MKKNLKKLQAQQNENENEKKSMKNLSLETESRILCECTLWKSKKQKSCERKTLWILFSMLFLY